MGPSKHDLKTVIITGGASGIGLETARLLLSTGEYRLALVSRDRAKLEDAQKALDPKGDLVSIFPCDLRDSGAIKKTMERLVAVHSRIYGLVNNAGVYPFGGIDNTTEQGWDDAMMVNLKAPFLIIQAAAEAMRRSEGGGRIVNVSSTAGILPNHFALAYSVSKAAMIQLTRTLAKEMGKDNITVNCVCPGIVRTPLHDAYHNTAAEVEQFYQKRGATFPLGRVGESRDVAGSIRFLLSDDAAWVTGDVLIVDGGRLLL
jgi:NAD(P)-dependent dehydrogenase (short-subunit alcohol dehydrogenase family)